MPQPSQCLPGHSMVEDQPHNPVGTTDDDDYDDNNNNINNKLLNYK